MARLLLYGFSLFAACQLAACGGSGGGGGVVGGGTAAIASRFAYVVNFTSNNVSAATGSLAPMGGFPVSAFSSSVSPVAILGTIQ